MVPVETGMMRLLEPQLAHNRAEYERLRRLKRRSILPAVFGGFLLSLAVVLFGDGPWVGWTVIGLLGSFGSVIGTLELRMTMVFRRDLRERRTGGGS